MDPLSLLAAAKVSYEAIKAGIAVGKELQGMAADLGSLFDNIAAITRTAADPKGSLMSGKSAQQIAMEAYAAKAEADAMMEDLKNQFIGEFGIAAWDQVLAHTTQIRKDQKAAARQAAKEQEEMMGNVLVGGIIVVTAITVFVILVLLTVKVLAH
jgi:CHASE3 domain sensor protein